MLDLKERQVEERKKGLVPRSRKPSWPLWVAFAVNGSEAIQMHTVR